MSRAIKDATAYREALSRLLKLDLGELRQQWRPFYKADASPHLSRELLVRAVAYRMQEITSGLPPSFCGVLVKACAGRKNLIHMSASPRTEGFHCFPERAAEFGQLVIHARRRGRIHRSCH